VLTEIASYRGRLTETVPRVRDRIAASALRAGRDPADVTLVAVSKGHPPEAVEAALDVGLRDLGENRVAELARKVDTFGRDRLRWHLIGHVQSRKAAVAASLPHLFHALDSEGLAGRLSRLLVTDRRELSVLLQVNTSGESSKGGFSLNEAVEAVARIAELPGLNVEGMMTMAPFVSDEGVLRDTFRALREVHERATAASGYCGKHLSMGMTNDFEIAIEEGSTLVRVGTALFGERKQ